MATVFLADDERLGRKVAVKRLHADSAEDVAQRFQREAKLGASLNHPNLVAIYDTETEDEGVLIIMEYVDGETLRDEIARGPLEPDRAIEVLIGLAAALDHAHDHGVVHRDVKPANVLISATGTVKLADLGIATASERTQITHSGTVLGTAAYMAPERLDGHAGGPEVDVYALAAVAFEAISGQKAVTGKTALEVARRVISQPPPDLAKVIPGSPPGAAAALRRGLAKESTERPHSAGELVRQLERAYARGVRKPSAAAVPAPRTEPQPKRTEPGPATLAGAAEALRVAEASRQQEIAAKPPPRDQAVAAESEPVAAGPKDAVPQPVAAAPIAAQPQKAKPTVPQPVDGEPANAPPEEAKLDATPDRERSPREARAPAPIPDIAKKALPGRDGGPPAARKTVQARSAALATPFVRPARDGERPTHGSRRWALPAALAAAACVAIALIVGLGTGGTSSKPASRVASGKSTAGAHHGAGGATSPAAPVSPATGSPGAAATATTGGTAAGPLGASTPQAAVNSFYQLPIKGDYNGAWALGTPALQAQVGGFDSWKRAESDLKSISFATLRPTRQTASTATVALISAANHGSYTDHCTGTVDVVRSGSAWMLEQLHIGDCPRTANTSTGK